MEIWVPNNQNNSHNQQFPEFTTSHKVLYMIIQGFDYMSEIELEVVQGSLVLTQDNDTMTLEDDELTKLARFIEDENERELYLHGSNILAKKSDTTHKIALEYHYIEKGETIRSVSVILLSESMVDELVEHLVNMGVA